MWQNLLIGLAAGLSTAASGYLKKVEKPEDFDLKKFLPTLILSGIAGVYAAYQGITLDAAIVFLASIGADTFLENWIKVFWRRWVKG